MYEREENPYKTLSSNNALELFKEFWSTLKEDSQDIYDFFISELPNVDFNNQADIDGFETAIIDTNNEDIRQITQKFYTLIYKEGKYIKSNLENYRLYKGDITARRIDILKMIQTPITREELVKRYNVESKTIRNDINALKNGTKILGTKIRLRDELIEEVIDGKITYRCTESAHPIFLLLNSIEAYDLIHTVNDLLKKDNILDYDNSPLRRVINLVKNQMSDASTEQLHFYKYNNDNPYFNKEERMLEYGYGLIDKLIAERTKCIFTIYGEEYEGYFTTTGIAVFMDNEIRNLEIPHKDVIYREI